MTSSTPNTKQAASPRPPTAASEDKAKQAHRRAADQAAQEAVEGLGKLARQKAARKQQNAEPVGMRRKVVRPEPVGNRR